MKNKRTIKTVIDDELIDLGLPLQGKTFEYWEYVLNNLYWGWSNESFSMMNIYDKVAKKFKTTSSRAERLLRYGVDKMKNNIIKKYNIKTKITNETIIKLFQLKIF